MSSRVSPATVGAFVLVGLALAVVITVVLGSGALFQDEYELLSFFEGEVTGLDAGSPVRYRGVPVGQVVEVRISLDNDPRDILDSRIPVFYSLNLTHLRGLVRGGQLDLEAPGALDTLINRGLRAQLLGANLVTGQRAIELEVFPDAEDNRIDPAAFGPGGPPAPEIPTVQNTMAQLTDRAMEAVDEVASIDFQGLASRLDSVLAGLDGIVSSGAVEGTLRRMDQTLADFSHTASTIASLAGDLQSTNAEAVEGIQTTVAASTRALASLDSTLLSIRGTLHPDAPVLYRLALTLQEMQDAARAVRDLASYLEQNPSSLLRGRPGSGGDR